MPWGERQKRVWKIASLLSIVKAKNAYQKFARKIRKEKESCILLLRLGYYRKLSKHNEIVEW
jgi:hypothetical protein